MGVEAAIIGSSLVGSAMAGRSAQKAAQTSANAQLESARIAAEEQRFRPVGITSRFGSSQFGFGPEGRLESAGYTASPEIQALQDRFSALYGTSLGQAEQAQAAGIPLGTAGQGLFGLGAQYLAQSPEAAKQQYIREQTDLLRAPRQEEEQRLAASVFGRGRAGLNVGAAGQPELAALASARRTQELQLGAEAERAAQQRIGFGAGLFGTGAGLFGNQYGLQTQALAPFQQQFGVSQLLEQAAMQPLDIGAQLGGRAATAGANVGQSLLTGGLGAAQTQLQGSLVGPSLMAQNISGAGQQYLQNRQQQQLFDRLLGPRTGGWGTATNTNAMYGPSGQYAGQFTPQAATWESAFQPNVYG
jgi:hypothetical protein